MRYFQRDNRFYIGPLTENQIDVLRTNTFLADSGIACQASSNKVEVFLTLPISTQARNILEDVQFKAVHG